MFSIDDYKNTFCIKKERGEFVLEGYKGNVVGTLIIPEGINRISQCAFQTYSNNPYPEITKIVFPSSLKRITKYNFNSWKNLKSVEIPDGVVSIDEYAFQNTGIEEITLPCTIDKIGKGAFSGCDELKKVTINHISSSILNDLINDEYSIYGPFSQGINENKLSFSLFFGTSNPVELTDFYRFYDRNDKKTRFSICADGFILSGDCIIAYIGKEENIVLPEKAKAIAPEAFIDNIYIRKVVFNEKMKSVGNCAFEGCSFLNSVTFNDSLEQIGSFAFANTKIENITIPVKVKYLGEAVFDECRELKNITVTQKISGDDSRIYRWNPNWKSGFDKSFNYDFV